MTALHRGLWEASFPPSLRGYRVDLASLPANAATLATEAAGSYQGDPAFGFMLPTGASTFHSFEEVDALSDAFAAFLTHEMGLEAGEVIAVQLPTCLHYPVAVFGAWKAGLIVTNVNPLYTERELRLQLQDSGARLLLASELFLQVAQPVAAELGLRLMTASPWDFFAEPVASAIRDALPASGRPVSDAAPIRMADALRAGQARSRPTWRNHPVALYQYTGGTTGRSKGAVITHRNILATLQMTRDFLQAYDGPRRGETILTVLPLYHIFAFMVNFLVFFTFGARNLLVPNPRPIANLRRAFEDFEVDWMSGVDTLYAGLLGEPWFQERPPKLRFAFSGGTALRPSTAQAWTALVCPILEGYGMTETTCIVSCNPPTGAPRTGSVGLPMPGCQVRIVDADGNDLGVGERGELLVQGPQVAAGYLNSPLDSASTIADGWLRTGDIAQMDADGYVRIVDRKKDMILVSGFNVYPNEVEDVLAAHPGILEAAVVGVPDAATGEAVRAYVVPRGTGLDTEAIERYCRTQLTAYKVPRQIVFSTQLPKSPVGKILRAQLRTAG
ncbi:long-chain fatty acid--CoA ligase [Paracidovorax avenae]|uniref:long-chain-fatty-acid--CoA ligase n=1 Tax=Paracidovorax avenae TaxID=80867 RepID=UPI000D211B85|nr:long-chain fatty acid--CoA ligase [Paracidovorax avenae]AVS90890.1 long-chain fatty acid--CoA ligase [Paracidovorax avenae]AVS99104.1 long-chain fatty acid--CoA ligase [Paracidovorax avenae]AVT06105.1 long-chain fatty acid--CoA ligase [Paracidovorax avenae]